jgi:hypothetical protein
MTRRPAAGFSLLFGILLSTTAAHAQPPASADFALKFEFKPCLTSSLDTDKNIYTWELGLGQGSVSTPLFLTTEETATIADAVRRVGFFDYPAVFGGGQPGANGDIVTVTPSTIYRLEVRDAGVVQHGDVERFLTPAHRRGQSSPDVVRLAQPHHRRALGSEAPPRV